MAYNIHRVKTQHSFFVLYQLQIRHRTKAAHEGVIRRWRNDEDAANGRHTCLTSLRSRLTRLVAYVHTNNDVGRAARVFT